MLTPYPTFSWPEASCEKSVDSFMIFSFWIITCFFFLRFLELFGVFYVSIQILRCFCFVLDLGKNAIYNLIGIALSRYTVLGSIVILTILILPFQEHSISFHLFVSPSVSFISVLVFRVQDFCFPRWAYS